MSVQYATIVSAELQSGRISTRADDLIDVFRLFDESKTGEVPMSVVKHLLSDVHFASRLDASEFNDFLRAICDEDPTPDQMIDYVRLSHNLLLRRDLRLGV